MWALVTVIGALYSAHSRWFTDFNERSKVMSVIEGFTTSNVVKVTDHNVVSEILDRYRCPDLEFERGELSCSDMEWFVPRALKRDKHPLPVDEASDEFLEVVQPILEKYGDSEFIELLGELAPYLTTPFTIQAINFVQGEFPIGAREWHVEPGGTKVEVKAFKDSA
jgi:hypothetical protein